MKIDPQIDAIRERVIFENYAFTIVKQGFLRFRGYKNRFKIEPKNMKK